MTEDEQRLLTEFLGECWHEDGGLVVNHYSENSGRELQLRYCRHCKEAYVHPSQETFTRLDFTDWRVVGRLVEKRENITIWKHPQWGWIATYPPQHHFNEGATPQEAICRAVIAWLTEREKENGR